DHEIFLRMRRSGHYSGYYDPRITVRHYVPPSRLTRRYFRQWFFWHGKTQARMLEDLFPAVDVATVPVIAGVPRFLYRQSFQQLRAYLRALLREDALGRLIEELNVLRYLGLFSQRWKQPRWPRQPSPVRRQPAIAGVRVAPQ